MKNRIKSTAVKAKNHVKNNKGAYTLAVIAAMAIRLQHRNLKDFYEFLEEKGIDPMEFYNSEYYEELHPTN